MQTDIWTPEPMVLPWEAMRGSLVCPGCPDHAVASETDRYELVLDGSSLDGGSDHHDALCLLRRAPGLGSGPFEVPVLPTGMPALAVIDFLERQTFDAGEVREIVAALTTRFPSAVVHSWPVGPDVSHRIAEGAYWDEPRRVLIRTPFTDIAPHEYPMDVGWARDPEHVGRADGTPAELWRGCLYVHPGRVGLVRYGWRDLPGPGRAPTSTA